MDVHVLASGQRPAGPRAQRPTGWPIGPCGSESFHVFVLPTAPRSECDLYSAVTGPAGGPSDSDRPDRTRRLPSRRDAVGTPAFPAKSVLVQRSSRRSAQLLTDRAVYPRVSPPCAARPRPPRRPRLGVAASRRTASARPRLDRARYDALDSSGQASRAMGMPCDAVVDQP